MWRSGYFLGMLAMVGLAVLPTGARAESISYFESDIEVQPDSSMIVTEYITYDFDEGDRHGIYRTIPIKYDTTTGRRSIRLEVLEVLRDKKAEPYEVTRSGKNIEIKIGSEFLTINNEHNYSIRYRVQGALNYFDDYDELYWNVTGNDWPVSIDHAIAVVMLPAISSEEQIQLTCYEGLSGSTTQCNEMITATGGIVGNTRALATGEGVTVAIGWPKGLVTPLTTQERIQWWLSDNKILALPAVITVVMLGLWFMFGRDPKGRPTIIPMYEPPAACPPLLLGAMYDTNVQAKDLTAGIVWLAQQGYISITAKNNTYTLTQLKPLETITSDLEKQLAEGLFQGNTTISLADLKNDTVRAVALQNVKGNVYKTVVHQGWYRINPSYIKGIFIMAGLVGGGFIIASGSMALPYVIAGIWTIIVVCSIGWFMPKVTKAGAEMRDDIKGFKLFLSVTEKDRLKFHNTPQKNITYSAQQFFEYLPYAIALGIEQQWAKQFGEIAIESPSWYHGTMTSFTAYSFISSMNHFTGTMNKSFAAAASHSSGSKGGGFSGGGFGGGGGGSW